MFFTQVMKQYYSYLSKKYITQKYTHFIFTIIKNKNHVFYTHEFIYKENNTF